MKKARLFLSPQTDPLPYEKSTYISLHHNNVQVADSHEGSNQDQTISMSVVLTLEQNDQVSVYLKKGQLRDRKSTFHGFTDFIGYLLF